MIPSIKRTICPYKGHASYWSVRTDSGMVEDLAWCYQEPLAEAQKIAGYVCLPQEHPEVELHVASGRVGRASS